MPYVQPFVRFKMNGHFGSSGTVKSEYWSAGLNIASATGFTPTGTTLTNFLTAVAPAVSALHGNTTINAGTRCFLDTLSAALIDTNGKYAGGSAQSTTIYTYPAPVAGPNVGTGPWSQAMAWSLRSAILRGPGSHGRCFYPALAVPVDPNTGAITAANQAAYLATVLTFINAVNTAAVANIATGSSVSNVSPIGTGQRSPVTRVGIGARLDTQESRERSTPEAYVFGNTTIARGVTEEAERDYLELLKSLPSFQDAKD
jgi:hypothetical protein